MTDQNMNIAIVVPTLNAGLLWKDWIKAVKKQTQDIQRVLIIDSGSNDGTKQDVLENGFKFHEINPIDFNHGATRQFAISLLDNIDIVVFLTQDAILAHPDSISELVSAFADHSIGAAYGRQLPRQNASQIETHGRFFNYPIQSLIKCTADRDKYGFNLIFISNSFAAYRVTALKEVGGFPASVILGEDTYICAKLVNAGWKIAYQAKAEVFHSHGYSISEEASRYFDMGVFHSRENWLIQEYGEPGGQGLEFVKSELFYLAKNSPKNIPEAMLRSITKFISYKLGRMEKYIPLFLKIKLSMNKQYWKMKKAQN